MKHYSIFLAAICCSLLFINCGGRGSSSSSSNNSSSSQTIQLQDYIIRLVPYYDDEPSQDYRMVDSKLVHIYSDSYKTVCGTVDRINESAFEVGVGGVRENNGDAIVRVGVADGLALTGNLPEVREGEAVL